MKPLFWIEGLIGAGKTTLTKRLVDEFQLEPFYEPVVSNPYLSRFYKDPQRWAFPMQTHIMSMRAAMHRHAMHRCAFPDATFNGAVMDRGLPGDAVFAKLQYQLGNMSLDEYKTYKLLRDYFLETIRAPAVVIYLDLSPEDALERIKARDRSCEAGVDLPYLQALNRAYHTMLTEIKSGKSIWSPAEVIVVDWSHHQDTPEGAESLENALSIVRDELQDIAIEEEVDDQAGMLF